MIKETIAYIGIGSNISPQKNIIAALKHLHGSTKVLATSTFYWTKAIGETPQPDFLNGVWKLSTGANAYQLKFHILRKIETALGRKRTKDKYAPRTIDLDILIFGQEPIKTKFLNLPDPDILKRFYLAKCLSELNPSLIVADRKTTKRILGNIPPLVLKADLPFTGEIRNIIETHNETGRLQHLAQVMKTCKGSFSTN